MKKKKPQITLIFLFFLRVFRVFGGSFSCHLIMMPRPHPETNENQHKRTAQQIGSPCHRKGMGTGELLVPGLTPAQITYLTPYLIPFYRLLNHFYTIIWADRLTDDKEKGK